MDSRRKAQPCKIIGRKKAALIFRPKGGLFFQLKTNRRNYCGHGLSASGRFI